MAESSSPALPGDVEWLPGPGGTRVLRLHPLASDPPALILRLAAGGERRIEATAGSSAIASELDWTGASLASADATRPAPPLPHGPHAEVIHLHPRRFARSEDPPREPAPGAHAPAARE